MQRAGCAPTLTRILDQSGFAVQGGVRLVVANGGVLRAPAGMGWFAAGDAAVHFDPLAAQGLLNAMFTGLASAEAADRMLSGEDPTEGYCDLIDGIWNAYRSHRDFWYRQECRWVDAPFWARRRIAQ